MRIQRIIGELCIFKHRVSSSKNEQKAAEHIYQIMRNIGLVASIDSFKSQQKMTWELITIISFFIVEVILYFLIPLLSSIAGLVGLILFWGYFTTRFKLLSPLFRHSSSQNVVGRMVNSNAHFKVIFTAHYDTAQAVLLSNPKTVANVRLNFLLGFFIIISLQIILILKILSINIFIFKLVVILIGIYIIGNIIVLLISGLKGEFVQGASDNASGVAVMLDLAVRLKGLSFPEIEFWFVSTGSKEVGAVGMATFMKMYTEDISKDNTYFINFDNVGKGSPHYFLGEGMLNFYKFSKDLIAVAKKSSQLNEFKEILPARYRLTYTDAIVPASRRFHSILLLAMDDRGLIPNWHWSSDTIENIDISVPQMTSDFVFEMVRNLHEILKQRLEKNKQEMSQFQQEWADSVKE